MNTIKKLISLFTVGCMLSFHVAPAYAEPPTLPPIPEAQENEPSVGKAISPMRKDQKAPFTGLLLSPEAIAEIMAELNSADEKIELERKNATQECQAKCDFRVKMNEIELETDKEILKAQVDARERENRLLRERLEKIENDQPSTELWMAGGAIAGIALTVLVVFAVSKTQNVASE